MHRDPMHFRHRETFIVRLLQTASNNNIDASQNRPNIKLQACTVEFF